MKTLSILVTRLLAFALSLIHRGGSLPGQIGLKLAPDILGRLQFSGVLVMVTGTNGKTSTSNMIADLFEKAGRKVVSNRRGDNMRPGIATAILTNTTLRGHIKADAMVLEVDELNVRHLLPQLAVDAFVVTNFFRDQLDRAREMEQLIDTIEKVLPDYAGTLILNANDPNVVRLKDKAPNTKVCWFAVEQSDSATLQAMEASEGKFCPRCGSRLSYRYYQYSHIGAFHCTDCAFQTPEADVVLRESKTEDAGFYWGDTYFSSSQEGLYTIYNCAAVCAIAQCFQLPLDALQRVFANAPQPKGRNESFVIRGQTCILNLVKNPTGANEVMKVIERNTEDKAILIVLNDKDQDGTDVSWIYDTHFEKLINARTKAIICSGTRAYDMALRMKYEGYAGTLLIQEDLQEAVDTLLDHDNVTLFAIATYTALLPTRNAICRRL